MDSRRDFLKKAVFVSGGTMLMSSVIGCGGKTLPNDLINIAMIGLGSHGVHNLKNYLKLSDLCRVVAVCDVYKPLAEQGKKIVDEANAKRSKKPREQWSYDKIATMKC